MLHPYFTQTKIRNSFLQHARVKTKGGKLKNTDGRKKGVCTEDSIGQSLAVCTETNLPMITRGQDVHKANADRGKDEGTKSTDWQTWCTTLLGSWILKWSQGLKTPQI